MGTRLPVIRLPLLDYVLSPLFWAGRYEPQWAVTWGPGSIDAEIENQTTTRIETEATVNAGLPALQGARLWEKRSRWGLGRIRSCTEYCNAAFPCPVIQRRGCCSKIQALSFAMCTYQYGRKDRTELMLQVCFSNSIDACAKFMRNAP